MTECDVVGSVDEDSFGTAKRPAVRFVGRTVAGTLIVVSTLFVLCVVFTLAVYQPRQRAEARWVACAQPHISAADRALHVGNLDVAKVENAAARACPKP